MSGRTEIYARDLLNNNTVNLNGKSKELSNYTFWHYTSLDSADKILSNKTFQIRSISGMNDLDEKALHGDVSNKIHFFSTCNSNSEKIPMWYLYSGIEGRGVALGITPRVMLRFINSIEEASVVGKDSIRLKKGIDFVLSCGWVYYRKKDSPSEIKYKNKWYSMPDELEQKRFGTDNYYIKSYPWEYEKEFRIVLKNLTKNAYEKLAINISSIYNELKIKVAPEFADKDYEFIKSSTGFQKFFKESAIEKSDLKIEMDILGRNKESINAYIAKEGYVKRQIEK